jgi:transporter family protein
LGCPFLFLNDFIPLVVSLCGASKASIASSGYGRIGPQSSRELIFIQAWFVLAFSVALLWGLSGIFAKYSTSRLGVARVALLIAGVEGSLYIIAYAVLREPHDFTVYEIVIASASCIIGISGYICFFESILDGQVAIAGTISAGYPALTVIGAVLFLSESLSGLQAVGVVMIIAGVIGLSYEPDPRAISAVGKRSLMFAGFAFFAWGAWSLSSKVAIDMIGPGNIFAFYILSSFTAPLLYAWLRTVWPARAAPQNPSAKAWSFAAIALALNVFGAFAYSYALDTGYASLVVPISSAYPIVTALLAMALLRERVNSVQGIALVGVVVGLVMIGFSI